MTADDFFNWLVDRPHIHMDFYHAPRNNPKQPYTVYLWSYDRPGTVVTGSGVGHGSTALKAMKRAKKAYKEDA